MADEMNRGEASAPEAATPAAGGAVARGAGSAKTDVLGFVAKIEAILDEYMVRKAPFQIPLGGKEFLAKAAPYLVIIFAVFAIPALFALLGISTVLAPVGAVMGQFGWGWWGTVAAVAGIVTLVLEVIAIPGLFKRTHKAWSLLFYASIVSLVGSIFSFNVIGGLIGAIIGWYILFQMRELYKN